MPGDPLEFQHHKRRDSSPTIGLVTAAATHLLLSLIGEGMTDRQIAESLFLAEKTVKNYVSSLLDKLGLQRRTQAALFAARHLPE